MLLAMRCAPLLLIGLLLLGESADAAPQSRGTAWPFGSTTAGRGRDLYNLGLIGAKASDNVRGEPEAAGSGRFEVNPDERFDDDGPEELRIELLFPDGPAQSAGLAIGDVIVGVGGRNFDGGCFEDLAEALSKATSKDGELKLRVRRQGEGSVERVELTLPVLGRELSDPTDADARQILGTNALNWLAEKQLDSGGFRETLSGNNGAVVMTCIAGLGWLAGGSSLEEGPHAAQLAKAVEFVDAFLAQPSGMGGGASPGGANWDQTNWGLAHAAIFLGELHERGANEEVRASLQRAATLITERQEASGGWAHGPGGPNALGYLELNIVSGLCLSGLGLALRAGCEVDEDKVELADEYIEASSSGGGVGYSDRDGQVGQGNIGRSAATWLGYVNLGMGRSGRGKQLASYVQRNVSDVQGGHASLMQHIFLAGVAAAAHGRGASRSYWEAMEFDLVLALTPDGSLQPRPWHESLSMRSNSDVSVGDVWTTACWACVLLADPARDGSSGLPAWCGQ